MSAYTVVGREAARLGAVASAAHILCFQLGVVTTQVCESAAIATQTLLAREMNAARPRPAVARHIVARGLLIGGGALTLTPTPIPTLTPNPNPHPNPSPIPMILR